MDDFDGPLLSSDLIFNIGGGAAKHAHKKGKYHRPSNHRKTVVLNNPDSRYSSLENVSAKESREGNNEQIIVRKSVSVEEQRH